MSPEAEIPSWRQFAAANIDPEAFTHRAHVCVAWQLLEEFDLEEALLRFAGALKAITRKFGFESKYHETITWFYMILIAERKDQSPTASWEAFCKGNEDLLGNSKALLGTYYSDGRLHSDAARQQFLLPDKALPG